MEEVSILKYLNQTGVLNDEMYECLAYDLNKHFYYYGDNFKRPLENLKKKKWKVEIANKVRSFYATSSTAQKIKNFDAAKPLLISNAYFNVGNELAAIGFNVIAPPWIVSSKNHSLYSTQLIKLAFKIKTSLELADFNYLVSQPFISLINEYREALKKFIAEKVSAIVLANDESFFDCLTIKICKELNVPSFVFLHGLPGIYNGKDGNRSDYLIVWSEKIKEHFIDSGISKEKIYVSGHPSYKSQAGTDLRFSLDNILVLSKAITWTLHADEIFLRDRAQIIRYLLMIQTVLEKFGVKKVRLRPHPSENIGWYLSFLNQDFFKPDIADLHTSLNESTLVIGPTSSVFLEALYQSVNYTVFEPSYEGKDIVNNPIVPPFDKSNAKLPVAFNEDELQFIIKNRLQTDAAIVSDYIQLPFNIDFIKQMIIKPSAIRSKTHAAHANS